MIPFFGGGVSVCGKHLCESDVCGKGMYTYVCKCVAARDGYCVFFLLLPTLYEAEFLLEPEFSM